MLGKMLTLVLTDALLFAIIRMVYSLWASREESLPLRYALLLLCYCVVAHAAATWTVGQAAETQADQWKVFMASVVFGAVPVSAYVHLVVTNPKVEKLVSGRDHLKHARRLRADEDITGALREYNKAFEAAPSDPRPLFAAAAMLTDEGRYDEAVLLFRKIMKRFERQRETWAKAGFRLASLLEHSLDDTDSALALLNDIVNQAPRSPFAVRARERLDK